MKKVSALTVLKHVTRQRKCIYIDSHNFHVMQCSGLSRKLPQLHRGQPPHLTVRRPSELSPSRLNDTLKPAGICNRTIASDVSQAFRFLPPISDCPRGTLSSPCRDSTRQTVNSQPRAIDFHLSTSSAGLPLVLPA